MIRDVKEHLYRKDMLSSHLSRLITAWLRGHTSHAWQWLLQRSAQRPWTSIGSRLSEECTIAPPQTFRRMFALLSTRRRVLSASSCWGRDGSSPVLGSGQFSTSRQHQTCKPWKPSYTCERLGNACMALSTLLPARGRDGLHACCLSLDNRKPPKLKAFEVIWLTTFFLNPSC